MSFCTMPIRPVKNAVVAPTNSTIASAASLCSNSGDMRATMKMPAVTIVAAWISAEIGVGPSIESGSQTCSGTCADLPIAPMNRQTQMKEIADTSTGCCSAIHVQSPMPILPDHSVTGASSALLAALANAVE